MTPGTVIAKVLIGLVIGYAGTRILARHGYDVRDPHPIGQMRAWLAVSIFAGIGGLAVELADKLSQ